MTELPTKGLDATTPQELQVLRARIRDLHQQAGEPSTRTISRLAKGAISHNTVNGVLRAEKVPRWGALEQVAGLLDGDVDEFKELWLRARRAETAIEPIAPAPIERTSVAGAISRHDSDADTKYREGRLVDAANATAQLVLAAVCDRAKLLRILGRRDAARTILVDALRTHAADLDDDNPDVLRARTTLAAVSFDTDYPTGVLAELSEIIELQRRLGTDDPDYLNSRAIMSWILMMAGRHVEVEAAVRPALEISDQTYGPQHAITRELRNCLGACFVKQGRFDEAMQEFRVNLDACVDSLGSEHPSAFVSRNNLGRALMLAGRLEEAQAELARVFEMTKRNLGITSLCMVTWSNLAVTRDMLGQTEEAEQHFRQLLEHQAVELGEDNFETSRSRHNLASILSRRGQSAEAICELERVLNAQIKSMGDGHSLTRRTRLDLAVECGRLGRWDDAEENFRILVRQQRELLGETDPHTLRAWEGLIDSLCQQGRNDEAAKELIDLHAIRQEAEQLPHPDIAYCGPTPF